MTATAITKRTSMAFPERFRDWQWMVAYFNKQGIPPNARVTLDDTKCICIEWEE